MGIVPVLARLPTIVKRVYADRRRRGGGASRTFSSSSTARTLPTPSRSACARALPALPIVDYVSPSVWAWRPGRAKKMRAYVDHVLALLPFEPEAHRRLGGPACTYVGHPLIERLDELRPTPGEKAAGREARCCWCCRAAGGQRSARLLQPFGERSACSRSAER